MRALIFIALFGFAGPACAHAGHEHAAGDFPWTFDPWISVPLMLVALLYTVGIRRLLTRSGRGRDRLVRRGGLFWLGWMFLAFALISPLHAAGERSFFLHMIEHEILMLAATPLLVLSEPLAVMLWALPARARRRLGRLGTSIGSSVFCRVLSGPIGATVAQAAVLWLWHTPALFNRALESDGWHIAQHLNFVTSALLFWNAMLGRHGMKAGNAGHRALAALCFFVTSLVGGALGALMAVSESPWYAAYTGTGEAPFGLTPAEDQQVAGLVMWVPGGMVHSLAALLVVASLLMARRKPAHAG